MDVGLGLSWSLTGLQESEVVRLSRSNRSNEKSVSSDERDVEEGVLDEFGAEAFFDTLFGFEREMRFLVGFWIT